MQVTPGSIDVTTYFVLRLTASGLGATGLLPTNFDLQYVRSGTAPSTKADATALAATNSAHTDNAAIEIDATDQPGLYRVDWPDAAFVAGVREVILTVKCDTAFTEHLRVELQTIQTGDNFARLGAPAGASVSADIAAIEAQTDDIGTAGAGLTAIPWNPAWDAEVQSEVADALGVYDPPTQAELVSEINTVQADIAALNNLSAAQVNAEVVDALATDSYPEPGQGTPAATTNLAAKLNYLYKWMRNIKDNNGATTNYYNAAGTVVDQKQSTAESAGTVTKGAIVSGP